MKSRLINLVFLLPMIGCMYSAPISRDREATKPVSNPREYSDSVVTDQITQNVRQTGFTNIRVRSASGVVTLCGYVDTENEKREVEEIAKRIDGVAMVTNHIIVGKNPPVNVNKPGGPADKPCDF